VDVPDLARHPGRSRVQRHALPPRLPRQRAKSNASPANRKQVTRNLRPPPSNQKSYAVILRKRGPSQREGLPTKDLCTLFAAPISRFWEGHGFSRAAQGRKECWALAPGDAKRSGGTCCLLRVTPETHAGRWPSRRRKGASRQDTTLR
jgi:hypothetical protein